MQSTTDNNECAEQSSPGPLRIAVRVLVGLPLLLFYLVFMNVLKMVFIALYFGRTVVASVHSFLRSLWNGPHKM